MWDRLRLWWPWIKAVLALAILAGVGWFFANILRSDSLRREGDPRSPTQILWDQAREARTQGLLACMVLYLVGLGFSGWFWILLMRWAGARITLLASIRAYYICHLGKYAPLGKGWALLLRTSLAAEAGANPGTAALTATYETLVTMAGGALLACIVLALEPTANATSLWRSLGLLAVAGIPILPGVFNGLVERVAARFGAKGVLPRFGFGTLLTGLAMTACGWAFLGASLYAVLYATAPQVEAWDYDALVALYGGVRGRLGGWIHRIDPRRPGRAWSWCSSDFFRSRLVRER